MFYLLNKKLIESPLSHGDALPCCLATSFKEDHSRGEHNVNIVELYFSVKIFVCKFMNDQKNQDPQLVSVDCGNETLCFRSSVDFTCYCATAID
jgi:hypothetical protein